MVFALLALEEEPSTMPYLFANLGIASALVFANLGAAYGTAKSATGICNLITIAPEKAF